MKLLLVLSICATPLYAQKDTTNVDTIPISKYQQQQLKELKAQSDEIAKQQNIILQTIVATKRDPKSLVDWTIQLTETAILLTPPSKKKP